MKYYLVLPLSICGVLTGANPGATFHCSANSGTAGAANFGYFMKLLLIAILLGSMPASAACNEAALAVKSSEFSFENLLNGFSKITNFSTLVTRMAKDSRIVYIGEFHPEVTTKEFLKDTLKHFKANGFNHLGMEMFNSNRQSSLTRFQERKDNYTEIRLLLDQEWGHAGVTEYYIDLMELATSLGIRLIAIDGRHLKPQVISGVEVQREKKMANEIIRTLAKDDQNKILILSGSFHGLQYGNGRAVVMQRDILRSQGFSSLSYKTYHPHESGRSTTYYGVDLSTGKGLPVLPLREYVKEFDLDTSFSFLETYNQPQYYYDGILFIEALSQRWR